ncbi:MAG TPA: cupin domain-containing protein, partial [Polyangia bacterium]|nr:cupin domain-containing protein [Polyangia bacterium]
AVEKHLAQCARCADDLRAAEETLALLGTSLQPVAPPPSLRARLLESTREETLADKLARAFDLAREKAAEILAQLTKPRTAENGWRPGPMPGMELYDFKAGPRLAGADTGLVRFPPKMRFPRHKHLGQETMLVLQGGFCTDDGRHLRPGDALVMETGTSHDMLIDDDGCVAAVSLRVGIDVEGMGPIAVKDF